MFDKHARAPPSLRFGRMTSFHSSMRVRSFFPPLAGAGTSIVCVSSLTASRYGCRAASAARLDVMSGPNVMVRRILFPVWGSVSASRYMPTHFPARKKTRPFWPRRRGTTRTPFVLGDRDVARQESSTTCKSAVTGSESHFRASCLFGSVASVLSPHACQIGGGGASVLT